MGLVRFLKFWSRGRAASGLIIWILLSGLPTAVTAAGSSAPAAPTNVVATVNGSDVTVTWEVPTSGATVTSFEVDWALVDPSNPNARNWWWDDQIAANVTSKQIAGLSAGTYDIRVSAHASGCDYGWQCASADTYVTAPIVISAQSPTAPGAPTNVVAVADTSTITVTWDAPTSGATVSGYELDWQNISAGTAWDYVFPSSSETSAVISNLIPGTYDVMISANASGCARASDCASASTHIANYVVVGAQQPPNPTPPQAMAPAVPANFGAAADGMGIALQWDAPDTTTSPAVDHYTYFWRLTSNSSWSSNTITAPATGVRVPSLAAGTYRVKVSAQAAGCTYASDCDSGDSAEIEIEISIPPPANDPPLNFQYELDGDNVTLTWETASTAAVGYEVSFHQAFNDGTPDRSDHFAPVDTWISLAADQLTFTAVHLRPTSWDFSVRANYADGHQSAWRSSPLVRIEALQASISVDYPRIYSSIRSRALPTVSGVPGTYSALYRSGGQVLKIEHAQSEGLVGIHWSEVSTCSVQDAHIEVDVLYLTETETQAIGTDCMNPSSSVAGITDFETRTLDSAHFEFMLTPIPVVNATFVVNDTQTVTVSAYDGDALLWPAKPEVGHVDLHTGDVLVGWMDSHDVLQPLSGHPIPGESYTAYWGRNENPLAPLRVVIAGHEFGAATLVSTDDKYIVWDDPSSAGSFDVLVDVIDGISVDRVLLDRVSDRGERDSSQTLSQSGRVSSFTLSDFEGCETNVDAIECAQSHFLNIRTVDALGNGESRIFYLLRAQNLDSITVTYAPSTNPVMPAEEVVLEEGPAWITLPPPNFGGVEINEVFAGWCTQQNPTSIDDCFESGSRLPVLEDTMFYPLWIEDPIPETITIGGQPFTASDWVVDHENRIIYLTVESPESDPLVGIGFEGPLGIKYWDENIVMRLDGVAVDLADGEYGPEPILSPGCIDSGRCSTVYAIQPEAQANNHQFFNYRVAIIATADAQQQFTVDYDLDNGETLTSESLPVGWHQVPTGDWARPGYSGTGLWNDSVYPGLSGWKPYFPVIDTMTLRYVWASGPLISGPTSVTLTRGQTSVGTYSSNLQVASWRVSDPAAFTVSNGGVVTAAQNLSVGRHVFSLFATGEFEGPAFEVIVDVITESEQAPVPAPAQDVITGESILPVVPPQAIEQPANGPDATVSPDQGSVPVTTQPRSATLKQQPRVTVSPSRSRLGIGASARIQTSGGLSGAAVGFASQTPQVCSVSAAGLVRARSVGSCVVALSATTPDPTYAPQQVDLVTIAVLPQGSVNAARVTQVGATTKVTTSLLSRYAGQRVVLLAVQTNRQGAPALRVGSSLLNRNALATVTVTRKLPRGTDLVVSVGGNWLYRLRLSNVR